MAYPDAWIYQITPDGPQRVAYEDTEHYQITSMFLGNRETMLQELGFPLE
jgi:predicted ATPase